MPWSTRCSGRRPDRGAHVRGGQPAGTGRSRRPGAGSADAVPVAETLPGQGAGGWMALPLAAGRLEFALTTITGCASNRSLSRCRTRCSRTCWNASGARAGLILRRGSRGRRASIWTTFVAFWSTGPTGSTGAARSGGSTVSSTVSRTWTGCASTSSITAQRTAGWHWSSRTVGPARSSSCCRWSTVSVTGSTWWSPPCPGMPSPNDRGARALTGRSLPICGTGSCRGAGYERYGAHGGDFGAGVATSMALAQPQRVIGIHQHAGGVAVHRAWGDVALAGSGGRRPRRPLGGDRARLQGGAVHPTSDVGVRAPRLSGRVGRLGAGQVALLVGQRRGPRRAVRPRRLVDHVDTLVGDRVDHLVHARLLRQPLARHPDRPGRLRDGTDCDGGVRPRVRPKGNRPGPGTSGSTTSGAGRTRGGHFAAAEEPTCWRATSPSSSPTSRRRPPCRMPTTHEEELPGRRLD